MPVLLNTRPRRIQIIRADCEADAAAIRNICLALFRLVTVYDQRHGIPVGFVIGQGIIGQQGAVRAGDRRVALFQRVDQILPAFLSAGASPQVMRQFQTFENGAPSGQRYCASTN